MKLSNNLPITKTIFSAIKKTSIHIYFFSLIFSCITTHSMGQNGQQQMYAFILSKRGNEDVVLYKSNSALNSWEVVGSTGRSNIRSLATDMSSGIIYAVDGGKLGSLNPSTGQFSSIGNIGRGFGEIENI